MPSHHCLFLVSPSKISLFGFQMPRVSSLSNLSIGLQLSMNLVPISLLCLGWNFGSLGCRREPNCFSGGLKLAASPPKKTYLLGWFTLTPHAPYVIAQASPACLSSLNAPLPEQYGSWLARNIVLTSVDFKLMKILSGYYWSPHAHHFLLANNG